MDLPGGYVRPEARRAPRDSRRVQAHRHQRVGHSVLRAAATHLVGRAAPGRGALHVHGCEQPLHQRLLDAHRLAARVAGGKPAAQRQRLAQPRRRHRRAEAQRVLALLPEMIHNHPNGPGRTAVSWGTCGIPPSSSATPPSRGRQSSRRHDPGLAISGHGHTRAQLQI